MLNKIFTLLTGVAEFEGLRGVCQAERRHVARQNAMKRLWRNERINIKVGLMSVTWFELSTLSLAPSKRKCQTC